MTYFTLSTKVRLVKPMIFPVVMYGCESWTIKKAGMLKNWCFWTVVLEKTLESPLDCKEIQPAHPKGDQSWVFIGRTDVEAETPILWPPDWKSWLIWKDPYAGKDWGQEEKGTTEDEMVGWHHRLNGHGFGWTPGVVDGQGDCHAAVHGLAKSWTRLNYWTEYFGLILLAFEKYYTFPFSFRGFWWKIYCPSNCYSLRSSVSFLSGFFQNFVISFQQFEGW